MTLLCDVGYCPVVWIWTEGLLSADWIVNYIKAERANISSNQPYGAQPLALIDQAILRGQTVCPKQFLDLD
jgi:hypothetical protein